MSKKLSEVNDIGKIPQLNIYGCPGCGSSIEIESIKDENINFSCFKCNNKQSTISTQEFLKSMENFNTNFNQCDKCHKKENNQINMKYCINHKKTLCDECINEHQECNLIDNNKKFFSCQYHPNEENQCFCTKCNVHLCGKCLKDQAIKQVHRGHPKQRFDDELTIYDKEKEAFSEIINSQENLITKFEIQKIEDIDKQYQIEKKELENKREEDINNNDKEKEKNLKNAELKAEQLLNDLEKRYKEEKKIIKYNLLKDKENINNNFKALKEEVKTKYIENLKDLEKKYEEEREEIRNAPEIRSVNNSLQITQLVQKMYNLYPDNYYYNRSYSNISNNFEIPNYDDKNNSEHFYFKKEKEKEKNNLYEINNINEKKHINESNLNQKSILSNNNHIKESNLNKGSVLSKKSNINESNLNPNINISKKSSLNDSNFYPKNDISKKSTLNENNDENNKKKYNYKIDSSLYSSDVNFGKKIDLDQNSIKESKNNNDKIIHKSSNNCFIPSSTSSYLETPNDPNKMPTNLEFEKEIIDKTSNLYCNADHSFEVICLPINNYFIIYSIEENENIYKIMCHNFNNLSNIADQVIGTHNKNIVGFRHIFDEINNRILLISISPRDFNIKLWETQDGNNWKLLTDIKNIYQTNELSSSCFLNYNNNIYIAASNKKSEPIKIFDLSGNNVKEIDLKKVVFFIDYYYDKKFNYILLGCGKSCKSYKIDEDQLTHSYYTKEQGFITSIIINESKDLVEIIGLDYEKKVIKIWDFYNGNHLFDINLDEPKNISGLCLWDKNYLLVGLNNEIGIFNLNEKRLINSLSTMKKGYITTIKKIKINEKYYLISHNYNESIMLWK